MIKKAIILAGGRGERLRPLTDQTPKPLLPVKGRPLAEWVILNLKRYGIEDIILSIGYKAEMIEEYFGDGAGLGVKLSYNIEKEPLGTGGAVKDICKNHGIREPFALVWGDNLANYNFKEMEEVYEKNQVVVVMALTGREDVEHFGVARLDGEKIVGFVEKPKREEAPSNLINAGAFIINPKVLEILPDGNSSIERDCFEKLVPEGGVYACRHPGKWLPTDSLEKYKGAQEEWQNG